MAKVATSGANLGFEAKLFLTADKLRGRMDASEYKHVALGLIFLKYISDAFTSVYERLKADELADEEDPEEYLAERTFWVPKDARCVLRPPLLLGGKTHFTGVPVGLPLCIIKSRPEAKSEAD